MAEKDHKPARGNPAGNQQQQIKQSGRTGDEESGSSQRHPHQPERDERSGSRSKMSRGGHEDKDPADEKQASPIKRNGMRIWVSRGERD